MSLQSAQARIRLNDSELLAALRSLRLVSCGSANAAPMIALCAH